MSPSTLQLIGGGLLALLKSLFIIIIVFFISFIGIIKKRIRKRKRLIKLINTIIIVSLISIVSTILLHTKNINEFDKKDFTNFDYGLELQITTKGNKTESFNLTYNEDIIFKEIYDKLTVNNFTKFCIFPRNIKNNSYKNSFCIQKSKLKCSENITNKCLIKTIKNLFEFNPNSSLVDVWEIYKNNTLSEYILITDKKDFMNLINNSSYSNIKYEIRSKIISEKNYLNEFVKKYKHSKIIFLCEHSPACRQLTKITQKKGIYSKYALYEDVYFLFNEKNLKNHIDEFVIILPSYIRNPFKTDLLIYFDQLDKTTKKNMIFLNEANEKSKERIKDEIKYIRYSNLKHSSMKQTLDSYNLFCKDKKECMTLKYFIYENKIDVSKIYLIE